MARKAAGIAACMLFLGSVAFGVAAWAQEHSHAAPRPMTFGERFDRFRRNIVGEEEAAPEPHVHRHPNAVRSTSPRSSNAMQRSSGVPAPAPSAAVQSRMTRQSAVKAQGAGKSPAGLVRRHTGTTAPMQAPSRRVSSSGSSSRSSSREIEPSDEEFAPEEASVAPMRRMNDEPVEASPEGDEGDDVFDVPEETDELSEAPAAPARAASPRLPTPRPTRTESRTTSPDKGVLFSRQSPVLSVETIGPKKITVGRPVEYKINIKNDGDFAATDVVVRVNLPASVEVRDTRATAGSAGRLEQEAGILQWSLSSLEVGASEQLSLELLTRENRPFDLSVRWASAAMGSNATVEVQEAKLELKISGAGEVLCGAKEVYRLNVNNPGNGDAENVVVHLLPLVPGEGEVSSHKIGSIPAGDAKMVEIELVARQGGKLMIQAEAVAEGDLKATAVEEVLVRQPALDVAISGPGRQYAGAEATYEIHVQNPGDAEARRVKLAAALPPESVFVSCTRGGKFDAKRNRVVWSLEDLAPGVNESVQVKCSVQAAGENRLEAIAIADGDLKKSQAAVTEVIAVADLVMDVSDPSGPVAVGQDAVYELRVRNRGTKSAEGVEIMAFYSKGIEPVSAEGGAHEISPGTVVFDPIASLGAGEEAVFKIHARADSGGTHRFRAELQCKPLSTKLTQEETTLFYGDVAPVVQAGKTPSSPAGEPQSPRMVRQPSRGSELR